MPAALVQSVKEAVVFLSEVVASPRDWRRGAVTRMFGSRSFNLRLILLSSGIGSTCSNLAIEMISETRVDRNDTSRVSVQFTLQSCCCCCCLHIINHPGLSSQ